MIRPEQLCIALADAAAVGGGVSASGVSASGVSAGGVSAGGVSARVLASTYYGHDATWTWTWS